MKKMVIRGLALVAAVAAAYGGFRLVRKFQQKQAPVPTAVVRKSDVIIRSYTRGELRAVRSATLAAPNLFGTVQITRLAPIGSLAREGDLIVEFDDSEVQSRMEERSLEVESLDEQLKKAQAELEISNNQDQVELLRARYAVRRAELEVKRNELLSAIDARKNLLNQDEAQRRLKQLESDIKSRLESAKAQLAVLREKRNRATLELNREKQRLSQVKLLATISGLVAVRQNRGNFMTRGMQLPDLREGDQVFPGLPVADVLDLSELEVSAKVGELDRANLHEGQDVTLRLDSVPDKVFHGRIKSLSGTASANIYSGDMAKKFDVTFSVDMKELLTGLGAKPEQIQRILAAAERNRSKPVSPQPMARRVEVSEGMTPGAPGGMTGGGPSMAMRAPSEGSEGGGGERPQGARRMGSNLSPENQTKLREAMQKFLNGRSQQDLSPEERQKMFAQMRTVMQGMGVNPPSRGAAGAGAGAPGEGAPGGFPGGPGGGGGFGFGGFGGGMGGSQHFSQQALDNAQLPPPPEEDNQLDVLLRPGLLADIEIIVEKIPSAIHIPAQAVFEREGKPMVYVKTGGQYEARLITPLKRSESTMVIASGLKPGEVVALADPYAKPGAKKEAKPAGKGPAIPAAGAGGGGR